MLAVGWQPSVVRAGVAGALASLAWLASRPSDRWYFLLLGAALLLAWSPYSLLDAGFQLSFAAVGCDLRRRPAPPANPGRVPGASLARRGRRGLRRVRDRDGADPADAVRRRSALLDPGERARGAGRRPAARDGARHGDRGSGRTAAALPLAWVNGWLAAYLAACARLVGGLPYAAVSARAARGDRPGRPLSRPISSPARPRRGRGYAAIVLLAR